LNLRLQQSIFTPTVHQNSSFTSFVNYLYLEILVFSISHFMEDFFYGL